MRGVIIVNRLRPRRIVWLQPAVVTLAVTLVWTAIPLSLAAQRGQNPAPAPARGQGLLNRPSPPQPQQAQGLDYFIGSWTFSWTGREARSRPARGAARSPSRGSRTAIFSRCTPKAWPTEPAPTKESGIVGWNDARKVLAVQETLANRVDILSVGDWSSPISILFDSQPVRVQGQLLRLKRTYSILSPTSFRVTEELSIDGGPFARLGVGDFQKAPK